MDIKKARSVMREALKDESLRIGYISNISMCIYDNLPIDWYLEDVINKEVRDDVSEKILNILFN